MKTLKDFQFKNKKVLLRVDFNLPLDEKGEILDDFRVEKTLPTINYLRKEGARIIILSHLGKGEFSLKPVSEILEKMLGQKIFFLTEPLGERIFKKINEAEPGDIFLLENLRFYPEEEKNDPKFSKKLAQLGDFFINDAFSVCHREHASVVGIPRYLPAGAGLLLEKEIKVLSRVLEEPWHPFVAIIGGVKIESKLPVIKNLLSIADEILLGGEIANTLLRAKKITISKSLPEEEIIKIADGLELTNPKLHLPIDVLVSPEPSGKIYIRESAPGMVRREEEIFDIGSETIEFFSEIIKKAKMIIWSGPLGLFENPLFERGTKEIADKIVRNHQAFKLAGGGDTLLALKKFKVRDKFDFVSTGGGAMLKFLAGEKLPGIEALK